MNIIKSYIVTNAAASDGGTQNLASVLADGNDGGGKQIKNIADPTASQDAATKIYVDDLVARRLLHMNNVSSSITGTITETVMDSILVPANTLQANDVLNIIAVFTKSGTAGTLSCRVRVNTQANGPVVAGSTQIGLDTGATNSLFQKFQREMVFKNSLSSEEILNTTLATPIDLTRATSAISSLSIDFSVAQYIFVTITLTNTGDTGTLRSWYMEIIR